MLFWAPGCSNGAGDTLRPHDIGPEAARSVAGTGQYKIHSKNGLAVNCICLFGDEDDPHAGESLSEADIVRKYRSCSNSSPGTAYAPIAISSGQGLIVILGSKKSVSGAELQTFDSTDFFNRAVNSHAPGCFKGTGAIIHNSSPALQVFE